MKEQNPNLKIMRLWAKHELAAGRQLHWSVGFAISNPTRKQIREWFPDCPPNLSKADTVEWLVRKAMEDIR